MIQEVKKELWEKFQAMSLDEKTVEIYRQAKEGTPCRECIHNRNQEYNVAQGQLACGQYNCWHPLHR